MNNKELLHEIYLIYVCDGVYLYLCVCARVCVFASHCDSRILNSLCVNLINVKTIILHVMGNQGTFSPLSWEETFPCLLTSMLSAGIYEAKDVSISFFFLVDL